MSLGNFVIGLFGGIDPLVIMLIVSALPVVECRGAIPYGLAMGLNPVVVFFGSMLSNILVVPVIFFFLEKLHFIKIAQMVLGRRISKLIDENHEKFKVYEELALFGFVAVPLPGTGAWTGALLASVMKLDWKKSFLVIAGGVFAACLLVFVLTYGVYGLFTLL